MEDLYANAVRARIRPLQPLLDDPRVTEIMVNGPLDVWVERHGRVERATGVAFASVEALQAACAALAQASGRPLDPSTVRFDARLPDGSRVHGVLPPVSVVPCLAIRRPSTTLPSLEALVSAGALNEDAVELLRLAMELGRNVLVSGGTGSGKTTLLSAILGLVPDHARLLVLEDVRELRVDRPHVVQLEARPAGPDGRGGATLRDLLHSALRLRPDRIVVGEVRGPEALDLLNALNTGHGGTAATLHASSPEQALFKLETLALLAGVELPLAALRAQVAGVIDLVVQIRRTHDGIRHVERVAEVEPGLDLNGRYQLRDVLARGPRGLLDRAGGEPRLVAEARAAGITLRSWSARP